MNEEYDMQVHLFKVKIESNNVNSFKICLPYIDKYKPEIQLKNKTIGYVPLIDKLIISRNLMQNFAKDEIIVNLQPLLNYAFDTHKIKIQTYEDSQRKIKGEPFYITIQFSLFLFLTREQNYVRVYFKQANLKKDFKIFGKMSPYIVITVQDKKVKTAPIKDGHLNPKFNQQIDIPFDAAFDKMTIEIKDDQNRIGYQSLYIFQLFGNTEYRSIELKKQLIIVGTLLFSVIEFEPQDF